MVDLALPLVPDSALPLGVWYGRRIEIPFRSLQALQLAQTRADLRRDAEVYFLYTRPRVDSVPPLKSPELKCLRAAVLKQYFSATRWK